MTGTLPKPIGDDGSGEAASPRFATTRWSLVLAAGRPDEPGSREALTALCRAYWYPLYAFIRRQGHGIHEAQDLTQEFLARLIERNDLQVVQPERGRFRSYLLGALKHFLANERDRARALKRGGGKSPIPLELDAAEDRYRLEPSHELTPERVFERRWAVALLDQVVSRLRDELTEAGKSNHFERLKTFLASGGEPATHAAAARELGMTEGAVKTAVHRLRRRYRDLLREEISRTLADPADVDEEIRYLFAVLAT